MKSWSLKWKEMIVEKLISSQYFSLYFFIMKPLIKIQIDSETTHFILHRLEASAALSKMLSETLLAESRSKQLSLFMLLAIFLKTSLKTKVVIILRF